MLDLVPAVFWLSCPVATAGILHMIAVRVDVWPWLKVPLDGGRSFRGRRIFGPNKTWRGVVLMILLAGLLGAMQGALLGEWAGARSLEVLDFARAGVPFGLPASDAVGYATVNTVFGLGYALGELPNSFIKRQLDIEAGKTEVGWVGRLFLLVDQADSVVFALLLGAWVFDYSLWVVVLGTVCLSGLHLAINASLYLSGLRKNL